jgi:hypothetical protein
MWRYPFGSGGKRVRIRAVSRAAPACAAAGPGWPPQLRAAYFPIARSASIAARMKFDADAGWGADFFDFAGADIGAILAETPATPRPGGGLDTLAQAGAWAAAQ